VVISGTGLVRWHVCRSRAMPCSPAIAQPSADVRRGTRAATPKATYGLPALLRSRWQRPACAERRTPRSCLQKSAEGALGCRRTGLRLLASPHAPRMVCLLACLVSSFLPVPAAALAGCCCRTARARGCSAC
jgi:hypothetical protein